MTIKSGESGTTYRNRLTKSIVLAIRKLMQKGQPDRESLDMAAYVVLALEKIEESIDSSATAWEKRDYWLKVDRFRMDWAWTENRRLLLEMAVLAQNWGEIASELILVAQQFNKIEVSDKNRLGEPWIGAWEVLRERGK
ncbi:MAG: hypothetical protein PHW11_01890 [Anaerolineaceae bacterium]|mgnify:CR=1 FL=1|jgi:hypothetical protein|nr:hypothetical protein [Anaerolineaceae bacterium]MDD4041981.1 hypothetical protein [Anaerolineaceae bacterium]MDD4577446.1 hypothetical protein [Anaerolineaceae bacterium]